jgi:hypothetical protein
VNNADEIAFRARRRRISRCLRLDDPALQLFADRHHTVNPTSRRATARIAKGVIDVREVEEQAVVPGAILDQPIAAEFGDIRHHHSSARGTSALQRSGWIMLTITVHKASLLITPVRY